MKLTTHQGFSLGEARVITVDHVGTPQESAPRITVCDCIEVQEHWAIAMWRVLKKLIKKLGALLGAAAFAAMLARENPGFDVHRHMPMVMGAISSAVASSWKVEIGLATHNQTSSTGDAFKTALFTSSATLGAGTTAYGTTNEVVGTGYTAGGVATAVITPVLSGTTAVYDLADASWTSSTFTANGSQTYNTSKSNKTWYVIAFGSDQSVTAGTFTIQWPTADASNAIVRIA